MISDYIQEEWYIYRFVHITLSAMWNYWQDVNKYYVTKIDRNNNNWKLFCHTKPPGIWRLDEEYIILNDKKVCLVWKAFLPDFM